jgi:uncharacterized protein (UPF0332 family)
LHLAKAHKLLARAQQLLRQHFPNDAARGAYLAAYHAAQAYIVDHAGRAAKTHSGAHTQFAQLAMHEVRVSEEFRSFLPKAFRLKAVVDYEFGDDAEIPVPRAEAAVETAGRFIALLNDILGPHDAVDQTNTHSPPSAT